MSRLVVGLGGATCSGKTTLARALAAAFPNARYLSQDDHYLPTDDPRHTWVKELRHVNWELVTAFDMDALDRAIREEKAVVASAASASVEERARLSAAASASEDMDALKKVLAQCQRPLLFVDGITLFCHPPTAALIDLRYFVTLDRSECRRRRERRTYDPPDVAGYFDKVVWPAYLEHLETARGGVDGVRMLRGEDALLENARTVAVDVLGELEGEEDDGGGGGGAGGGEGVPEKTDELPTKV